jgi:hypothetical protein
VVVIVASVFMYRHPLTVIQVAGYFIALFGLGLYDEFKRGEDRPMGALLRITISSARMLAVTVAVVVLGVLSMQMGPAGAAAHKKR